MNDFMQPRQDLMNDTMNIRPQQQNDEQEQEYDPLNTGMVMSQQEMEEHGIRQAKDTNLLSSLQRTEVVMRQRNGVNAAPTSESLERAAEVSFQHGINSRKGSCETRNAHRKRMRAHNHRNPNFAQGLTEHSGRLADQLQDNERQEAQRQRVSDKCYDNWTKSSKYNRTRQAQNDGKGISAEEMKLKYANKIAVAGWLKDDQSREYLFGSEPSRQTWAYTELLDRALAFELQPNALCTLSAMQRAAEVMQFAPFVQTLHTLIRDIDPRVKENIPPDKFEQFNKFHEVFGYLKQGTEAAIHLQGVNADGKNRYGFYSDMTLGNKLGMERDYAGNKKQRSKASAAYERELAQYNAAFADKEALSEQRLAFIEESTGAPLSEQVYNIKCKLAEAHARLDDKYAEDEKKLEERNETEEAKKLRGVITSAQMKPDLGMVLTAEEKLAMNNEAYIAAAKLFNYIETDQEWQTMISSNPEVRAVQTEKILDRMLQKLPHPLSADVASYSCTRDVQASVKMTALAEDISQVSIVLFTDPLNAQYVSGAKREQLDHLMTIATQFIDYETITTGIMGITHTGKILEDSLYLGNNLEIKIDKEQFAQAQSEKAEQYKQAVQLYNEYYENSDEQSQQKIAKAKELLGTDLGATKHTFAMAEVLQKNRNAPVPYLQLRSFEGIGRMLDSSVTEQQAEAQSMLLDKLMAFPLDAARVSATPDMEQMPKIIAHGMLVDQMKREVADNKAAAKLLPADKLAQWDAYTDAFTALYATAATIIGRVGLTVEGASLYANKPGTTPEAVAADKYRLGKEYGDERTKLELLGNSYAARYLADDETKKEAAEAVKLLGTSVGITKDSYKLATALQGNKKQEGENAEVGKQWLAAWSESEEGKRQIESGKALQDKKDAHASKRKELKQEKADKMNAWIAEWKKQNPGKRMPPKSLPAPEVEEVSKRIAEHGKKYNLTEEETKLLPLSAHEAATQVLHLLEGDDREKLFSADPKLRAEAQTAMAEKLIADGLEEKQLTDPALLHKLPALLGKVKDAQALDTVLKEDTGAAKFRARSLAAIMSNYAVLTRRVSEAAPKMLQPHGLTIDGNSLYKGREPKASKDYRQIAMDRVVSGTQLMRIEEKYSVALESFIGRKEAVTKEKEQLAKEEQERLEKEKRERLQKELAAKKEQMMEEEWERKFRKQQQREYDNSIYEDPGFVERTVAMAKKERADFKRRKKMSPEDARKDMVEDGERWLTDWNASPEGKKMMKEQEGGGKMAMSKAQTADAAKLVHLLTDAQRERLFSYGESSERNYIYNILVDIITGQKMAYAHDPESEHNKTSVQQNVARLAKVENAKALQRLMAADNATTRVVERGQALLDIISGEKQA